MVKQKGERPIKGKLYSASDGWRDHRSTCEVCIKVHVQRTETLAHACYEGALLLKAALADAAANGIRITDAGREYLGRSTREEIENE